MTKGPVANAYAVQEASDGFAVCHNGLTFKTPASGMLIVPTKALAEALAEELSNHQPVRIGRKVPPLLQLAMTAIDIVNPKREEAVSRLLAYAGSELLCHRAERPSALVEEQEKIWQPLLDWCAERFKAPLHTGTGIMPIIQPPDSVAALHKAIEEQDVFRIAGLSAAVGACGSLVLGLAMEAGHLNAAEACHAAELDAAHQMKEWGDDPEIALRIEGIRKELVLCEQWFALLQK